MLKGGVNNFDDFSFENEMNNNTRYIFSFEADIVFDEETNGPELYEKLANAYEENDSEAFKDAYNKAYFNDRSSRIEEILTMYGDEGFWPHALFKTIKPMTFREFCDKFEEEYECPYFEAANNIVVCKIIEENDIGG